MCDHLGGRWSAPFRQVFGRVRVGDQRRVVAPHERAMKCGADARVGLRADDQEPTDTQAREHGLEGGVFEGVAVTLLDERLGVARIQLRNDLPAVASPRQVVIGVLDPDHGDMLPTRLAHEGAHVRKHRITLVCPFHDAVLQVDDEERRVRTALECGHACSWSGWLRLRPR